MKHDPCITDIGLIDRTHYSVQQAAGEVVDWAAAPGVEMICVTAWTGSDLMPPTSVWLRVSQIASIRELSEGEWAWSKRVTALHYARQAQDLETSAAQEMKRLVDIIGGDS
jgi:hypothetical protein